MINKKFWLSQWLLITILVTTISVKAETQNKPASQEVATQKSAYQITERKTDKNTLVQYILSEAEKHGVNGNHIVNTIQCESGFRLDAVGDGGNSYGIAQYHLPGNKNITKEKAVDPYWSIDTMIQWFKRGDAKRWTCYRQLYM